MLRAPRRATPGSGVCRSQREPPPGDSPASRCISQTLSPCIQDGALSQDGATKPREGGKHCANVHPKPYGLTTGKCVERNSILNFIEFQLVGEMVFTADAVTLSATVCDVCRCWRGGKGCCSMPQYGVISVSLGVYKSAQVPRFE